MPNQNNSNNQQNQDKKYKDYVEQISPKPPYIKNYIMAFIVGGIICIIGQILIDKTKLTPARILVLFVTVGAILGGLGIYQHLINFAGAGATVPITGFGANLAKGAIEEVQKIGLLGAFTGGVKASAGGIAAAIFFGYIASLIAKPKIKKQ